MMRQKPDDGSLFIYLFINPHQDNATTKTHKRVNNCVE